MNASFGERYMDIVAKSTYSRTEYNTHPPLIPESLRDLQDDVCSPPNHPISIKVPL